MSKIVPLGGFITRLSISGPPMIPETTSLADSFLDELNNACTKKNRDILVDAGLNIIGKRIKKWMLSIIGSGIILRNNEIKDIMKVIVIRK